MAKTITFEIEVDEKGAVKSLNKIEDSVEDVGKSTKKAESGLGKFGKTLGNLGKAAGIIGLISAAFELLQETLFSNQKVMDLVNTSVNALKIAFNDLYNFLVGDFIDTIVGIWNEPQKALDSFKKAINDFIDKQLNLLFESIGLLGDAFNKLFEGDFTGALETAGEGFVQLNRAINPTVIVAENLVNAVVEGGKALADYAVQTYEAAEAITVQQKSLRLLELQQTRIREQSDRDAERQRQIRDDETRSIDERIEANRELARILDEQEEREKATVNARIATLQQEQELLGFQQERYEEIFELQTELAAIEAQQAGFRSEQLINENQLLKEKQDLLGFQTQAELDSFNESIEAQKTKAEQEFEISEKSAQDQLDLLDATYAAELEKAEQFGEDTTAITAKYEKEKADIVDKEEDRKKKLRQASANAAIGLAGDVSGIVGQFAEEDSKIGKAAAATQATIDTIQGAQSAFAQTPGGILLKSLAAGAAVAIGVANVQKILAVKPVTRNSAKTAATPAPPTAAATPPQLTAAVNPETNQLAADIADINETTEPTRAYVVSSDVTTQQQFDRNTEKNATF